MISDIYNIVRVASAALIVFALVAGSLAFIIEKMSNAVRGGVHGVTRLLLIVAGGCIGLLPGVLGLWGLVAYSLKGPAPSGTIIGLLAFLVLIVCLGGAALGGNVGITLSERLFGTSEDESD